MADQRRDTTLVPPQPLVTLSLKKRSTEPPPSGAVAVPVLFVETSAGHSRTTLAGMVSNGGVVSLAVIRWTQVLWFPQSSVADQVRSTTLTMAPGGTTGCVGNGPSGGCSCGGGRGFILFRLPIEIVLLPTVMGTGGLSAF